MAAVVAAVAAAVAVVVIVIVVVVAAAERVSAAAQRPCYSLKLRPYSEGMFVLRLWEDSGSGSGSRWLAVGGNGSCSKEREVARMEP